MVIIPLDVTAVGIKHRRMSLAANTFKMASSNITVHVNS